jgi:hypothetical protein
MDVSFLSADGCCGSIDDRRDLLGRDVITTGQRLDDGTGDTLIEDHQHQDRARGPSVTLDAAGHRYE